MDSFKEELANLISKYSIENNTNTPDYVLAQYLIKQLKLYEETVIETINRNQKDSPT